MNHRRVLDLFYSSQVTQYLHFLESLPKGTQPETEEGLVADFIEYLADPG